MVDTLNPGVSQTLHKVPGVIARALRIYMNAISQQYINASSFQMGAGGENGMKYTFIS